MTCSVKQHANWLVKVDGVRLEKLTSDVVAKWIKTRIQHAGSDPTAQEKAKHTINHVLRSAKALFSQKKNLCKVAKSKLSLLPQPIPLSDVALLEEDSSARFTPSVDPETLLLLAQKELGAPCSAAESEEMFAFREQQWIAFLLSFCGGLRRKESDLLAWQQVHLDHTNGPRIQLDITEYFKAQTKRTQSGYRWMPRLPQYCRPTMTNSAIRNLSCNQIVSSTLQESANPAAIIPGRL